MLTIKGHKEDLIEGFEAGADDYITKPWDIDELKARLQAAEKTIELQIKLLDAEETMRHQATHDSLTGLLNRDAILNELHDEFQNRSAYERNRSRSGPLQADQ